MQLLLGFFGVVLAGLFALLMPLLVYLSIALSGLFLGLPLAVLHVLLRWLADVMAR
jgi:hypothetical protein